MFFFIYIYIFIYFALSHNRLVAVLVVDLEEVVSTTNDLLEIPLFQVGPMRQSFLLVLFSFLFFPFTLSHFYFSPDADVLQDHNPHRNRAPRFVFSH